MYEKITSEPCRGEREERRVLSEGEKKRHSESAQRCEGGEGPTDTFDLYVQYVKWTSMSLFFFNGTGKCLGKSVVIFFLLTKSIR